MNPNNSLVYYLEDLTRLEEISTEQLNAWVAKKPYCQNLRMLKAKKEYNGSNTKKEDVVAEASFYSIDRARLFHYLHDLSLVKYNEEETVLPPSMPQESIKAEHKVIAKSQVKEEVADAETNSSKVVEAPAEITTQSTSKVVESTIKAIPKVDTKAAELSLDEAVSINEDIKIDTSVKKKKKKKSKKKKDKVDKEKAKFKNLKKKKSTKKKKKIADVSYLDIQKTSFDDITSLQKKTKRKKKKKKSASKKNLKSQLEPEYTVVEPLPLTDSDEMSFTEWLMHIRTAGGQYDIPYQDYTDKELSITTVKKKKKKKRNTDNGRKKDKVQQIAKKSVAADDEIISAELADLLALQGKNKKAKKMYKKLSLKFPEKSSFFAAKIDLIDQKI